MKAPDSVDNLLEVARAVGYGEIPSSVEAKSYTIGAFDLLVINARDKQNIFELIESLCAEYKRIREDKKWLQGYIWLLTQSASPSDTTELPSGMGEILSTHPECTADLRKWYRK